MSNFFYKKKRNTPDVDDLIMYKNMAQLIKYEGIGSATATKEHKSGIIRKTYFLKEKNGEFWYYMKGYVRFHNPDESQRTVDALRKRLKYKGREKNLLK